METHVSALFIYIYILVLYPRNAAGDINVNDLDALVVLLEKILRMIYLHLGDLYTKAYMINVYW